MTLCLERKILPSRTRVVAAAEAEAHWADLLAAWGMPPTMGHFPGSHAVPLDRATGRLLRRAGEDEPAYVVALKTDGVRYVLFLTTRPDADGVPRPVALMIDRGKVMYEVCVWANLDFFEGGSVFDGELAWRVDERGQAQDELVFHVFDVVRVRGHLVAGRPFAERLQIIHDSLFRAWKPLADDEAEAYIRDENKVALMQHDPVRVVCVPKAHFPLAQMQAVWAGRAACGHRVDGLLFTQCQAPMEVGQTRTLLKWKPKHTVDVALRLHADEEGGRGRVEAMVDLRGAARRKGAGELTRVPLAGALRGVDEVRVVRNALVDRCADAARIVECLVEKRVEEDGGNDDEEGAAGSEAPRSAAGGRDGARAHADAAARGQDRLQLGAHAAVHPGAARPVPRRRAADVRRGRGRRTIRFGRRGGPARRRCPRPSPRLPAATGAIPRARARDGDASSSQVCSAARPSCRRRRAGWRPSGGGRVTRPPRTTPPTPPPPPPSGRRRWSGRCTPAPRRAPSTTTACCGARATASTARTGSTTGA